MAREVIIRIRDDIDPEKLADKTVTFSYQGCNYEIDLTAEHCDEFDQAIGPFVAVARVAKPEPHQTKHRKRGGSGMPPRLPEKSPAFEQRLRIREWAQETGFHVAKSGMLAKRLIEAYRETHPDDPIRPDTWCKAPVQPKRLRPPSVVAAQNGSEQSAFDLLSDNADADAVSGAVSRLRDQITEKRLKPLRAKIRDWSNANGIPVAGRSRIPQRAVEAYRAAHPDEFDEQGAALLGDEA